MFHERLPEPHYGQIMARTRKGRVDPETQRPLEPAHKFETNLELDTYTEEKYEHFRPRRAVRCGY